MRKNKWISTGTILILILVLTSLLLFGTEMGGAQSGPASVRASGQMQQRNNGQSLAEFREVVAVSIGRIASQISNSVSGSAGGRLPNISGDKNKDDSTTGKQPEAKAAESKKPYDPYNVYDYDSADDFAEDYVYEFAEEYYDDEPSEDAYDDAYDDACEYWESKHR